jgi:hypothetical protein
MRDRLELCAGQIGKEGDRPWLVRRLHDLGHSISSTIGQRHCPEWLLAQAGREYNGPTARPPRSFPAARLDRPLARRSLTLDPARPQHPRTGKAADHKRTTAMVLTPAQRAQLLAGVGLFSGAGEDGRA